MLLDAKWSPHQLVSEQTCLIIVKLSSLILNTSFFVKYNATQSVKAFDISEHWIPTMLPRGGLRTPRCSASHTGEKRHFRRCCRLLATPFSASLTIGEDDVVLVSFGDHRKPIWLHFRCRFTVDATATVVAMLVLASTSFGDGRTPFWRSTAWRSIILAPSW